MTHELISRLIDGLIEHFELKNLLIIIIIKYLINARELVLLIIINCD